MQFQGSSFVFFPSLHCVETENTRRVATPTTTVVISHRTMHTCYCEILYDMCLVLLQTCNFILSRINVYYSDRGVDCLSPRFPVADFRAFCSQNTELITRLFNRLIIANKSHADCMDLAVFAMKTTRWFLRPQDIFSCFDSYERANGESC